MQFLPNLFSVSRLVGGVLVVWFAINQWHWAAWLVVCYSCLSDFLDGFFARRYQQVSRLGSILDPVSDKGFSGICLLYLWLYQDLPSLYFWAVAVRYVVQLSSIPVLAYVVPRYYKVKPNRIAKFGTLLIFVLLLVLFAFPLVGPAVVMQQPDSILVLGSWLLLVVSGLIELYILATFLPRYWQILRGTADCFE